MTQYMIARKNTGNGSDASGDECVRRSVMDDDDFDGIFMSLRPIESTLHKNM